ncbi:hypothetical protein H0H92_005534 [Tricholoma furcatifolium]|nr:hypothetical protein H0H92_005534 [Tricholoma furcatifolium]
MSADFVLLTAFSKTLDGGNPAAVIFIRMDLPTDTFMDIAQNFNQPITAFVSTLPLPVSKPRTIAFSIRWCSASREDVPLCGHGTLAAAKAVFDRWDNAKDIEFVEFHTLSRGTITARKRRGGLIEIQLPAATTYEVSSDEFTRISEVVNRTCGRELIIKHIARGGEGFHDCELCGYLVDDKGLVFKDLMIVVDEKEDIENLYINFALLQESIKYVSSENLDFKPT